MVMKPYFEILGILDSWLVAAPRKTNCYRLTRRLRRVVPAQTSGFIARFAGKIGHHRARSGLRIGAAAGLRLFAHGLPPDFSDNRVAVF